jgi:hypothetical protein
VAQYTDHEDATYEQSHVSLEFLHELCLLKISIPTMAQHTSYQYVNNMFSGRSATNSLPIKYVKTNFTIIYELSRFSERYVTNSVLTKDVTASTVTSNTPQSGWHVEMFPEKPTLRPLVACRVTCSGSAEELRLSEELFLRVS